MKLLVPVGVAALLVGCAARVGDEPIPDSRIGLSPAGLFEVADPDPVTDNTSDPGERSPLPRAYDGSPPVISHAVTGFLPITRENNLCVDCHLGDWEKGEGVPTPIPQSHLIDLRNAPEKVGADLAGARYVCTACHVPLTSAPPLVENRF